jgi:hypothetical protein
LPLFGEKVNVRNIYQNKNTSKKRRSEKSQSEFLSVKLLILLLILIAILSGCETTSAPIVISDSFCESKYSSIGIFSKKEFEIMKKIRNNDEYRKILDRFIDYTTINEKEFKFCQK